MTTRARTVQQLAEEASQYLTVDTRNNGVSFVKLTTDAPEWVGDVVQTAHAGMFPDDTKYAMVKDALSIIAEADDIDDLNADSMVPVYTARLTAWVASHLDRVGYVDEFVAEMGSEYESLDRQLAGGYYMEAREVLESVKSSLQSRSDDLEYEDVMEEARNIESPE